METTAKNANWSLRTACATLAFLIVLGFSGTASASCYIGATYMPPPPPPPVYYHNHVHGAVGFSVNTAPSVHYRPVTQTQTVQVAPPQVASTYVPPTYTTVIDVTGVPRTVKVSEGYWTEQVIPAQYQTVTQQVVVPVCKPSVNVGVGFRF